MPKTCYQIDTAPSFKLAVCQVGGGEQKLLALLLSLSTLAPFFPPGGTSDTNGVLPPTPSTNGENGKATADVVDLTLDSSSSEDEEEEDEEEDDDDEGPKRKQRRLYKKGLASAC